MVGRQAYGRSGDDGGGKHVTRIDAQRVRALFDAHGAALTLYARQWCRAPEDALQEALIDLLRQTSVPDHPVAWLYKTVRRRAMNLARAERRRVKHHRQAGEQRASWFLPKDGLEEPADVEALLRRLPPLEREIVVARVWGELSFVQIADLVDRSISSVHRRYQRALAELGRMMNTQLEDSRQNDEPKPSIP
jgi:RNA polymerase sigma-70 factor (ECF subfamily)